MVLTASLATPFSVAIWLGRASVSSLGDAADFRTPTVSEPSISSDGRYVAFDSFADNLDPNADGGVFVRDTRGQTTTAVSVRANGTVDDFADTPAISGDGRFVAFVSDDKSLVPGGTAKFDQIFLRDRTSGVTTRVSSRPNGKQATDDSDHPSVSSDGHYIAFESDAAGLVPGDTNASTDVFVRDRVAGTTTRVSLMANGTEADLGGESPSISGDGRYVAFTSSDTLVPADANTVSDVYVRDRVANTTTLVSVGTGGAAANGENASPSLSASGRFVAFTSIATDLDGLADTNGAADVFVRDLVTGVTERVSRSTSGGIAHGTADTPTVSSDGRFVSYQSTAADAVAGDTNGVADAFVYDRLLSSTTRTSTDAVGGQLAQGGTKPALSSDGRVVAFATDAPLPGLGAGAVGQLYTRLTVPAETPDPPPAVSIGNTSVVEGDARARQARFTVTISRPLPAAVSVPYATVAVSATAGSDFTAKSGSLALAAGATSGVVNVDVKGDRRTEPDEAFRLQLGAVPGLLRSRSQGTATIMDDDQPSNPAVQVSIGNASLVEGDVGTRKLRFPVTLSQASPSPVTVWFATANGSATAADYTSQTGVVTIAARAVSATIEVPVKPDFLIEPSETFRVTLLSPAGATIERATGTGTILDDD